MDGTFSQSENFPLFEILDKIFEKDDDFGDLVEVVESEGGDVVIVNADTISMIVERLRYETDDSATYLECFLAVLTYLDLPLEDTVKYINETLKQKLEEEQIQKNTIQGKRDNTTSLLDI